MGTDRELLERAAKAAGLVVHDQSSTGLWVYPIGSELIWEGEYPIFNWSPLNDDGDALRLAVRLGISVDARDPEKPVTSHSEADDARREGCVVATIRQVAHIDKGSSYFDFAGMDEMGGIQP